MFSFYELSTDNNHLEKRLIATEMFLLTSENVIVIDSAYLRAIAVHFLGRIYSYCACYAYTVALYTVLCIGV